MKRFAAILGLMIFIAQGSAFANEADIDQAFATSVQNKIESTWIKPATKNKNGATYSFKLNRFGQVIEVKKISSSGNEKFDESAYSSIYKSAPFNKLPDSYSESNINFLSRFNPDNISISVIKPKNANSVFSQYMKELQRTIKSNWKPTFSKDKKRAVAFFTIYKNGSLGEVKILKSSGDSTFDENALTAIKKTAPFHPLPRNFKGKSVDIEFTFDYTSPGIIKSVPR